MKSKKLIAFLLILTLGVSQFNVALADKKSDAESKKKAAQEELKSKQNEIDNIEQEQQQLKSEIDALDAELVNVIVELSTLEEELAIKHDELAQTKEELKQAKQDEKDQYEAMKLRIRFMYEKGDSAMLTRILESKSIADLLNRVEYVNQMYDYDRNLLTEYENVKKQVAKLQKQQKAEVAALEDKQQEYQVAEANYRATIDQKRGEIEDFDQKLAAAQTLAAKYQDTINAQNVIIAKENKRIEQERKEKERLEKERKERERLERELWQQEQEEQQRAAANNNFVGAKGDESSGENSGEDESNGGNAGEDESNGGSSGGDESSGGNAGGDESSGGNAGGDESSGGNAGEDESNGGSSGGDESGGNAGGDESNGGSSGGDESGGGQDPGYSTGVSGSELVQYALGFVGNPYVWGGKDPNTGADCSGFTSYVYAHFGINIPSYSYAQRTVGQEVSYANAQPGDLICYAGHVAIYMGNGQIVHAKGTAYGIVAYDNATYREIITVRRLL
ncbi:MAG: hypothetical protein HFI71_04665 [Lachnospiraceae bacterium]|nr:hypothetical protein [Lachnospiraceae bacterium]